MKKLLFSNPLFNKELNLTTRRGIKWANEEEAYIDTLGKVKLSSVVIRFCDINNDMLAIEHDPDCRTTQGLLKEMQKVYPGFDAHEIVTLVTFRGLN